MNVGKVLAGCIVAGLIYLIVFADLNGIMRNLDSTAAGLSQRAAGVDCSKVRNASCAVGLSENMATIIGAAGKCPALTLQAQQLQAQVRDLLGRIAVDEADKKAALDNFAIKTSYWFAEYVKSTHPDTCTEIGAGLERLDRMLTR